MKLTSQRVYDAPDGGYRVLADRLWPRGLTKGAAAIALWAKELAPSTELRTWYHRQGTDAFADFAARYRAELEAGDHAEILAELRRHPQVTLLTAAKDLDHSEIPVLRDWLEDNAP